MSNARPAIDLQIHGNTRSAWYWCYINLKSIIIERWTLLPPSRTLWRPPASHQTAYHSLYTNDNTSHETIGNWAGISLLLGIHNDISCNSVRCTWPEIDNSGGFQCFVLSEFLDFNPWRTVVVIFGPKVSAFSLRISLSFVPVRPIKPFQQRGAHSIYIYHHIILPTNKDVWRSDQLAQTSSLFASKLVRFLV